MTGRRGQTRVTATAEARLEHRKSCEFQRCKPSAPFFWLLRFGCDRILLRRRPGETEDRAQRAANPGILVTFPADRQCVVEHRCVIATIRSEDVAQNLDKLHNYVGV